VVEIWRQTFVLIVEQHSLRPRRLIHQANWLPNRVTIRLRVNHPARLFWEKTRTGIRIDAVWWIRISIPTTRKEGCFEPATVKGADIDLHFSR
jgi:hypothetical protein